MVWKIVPLVFALTSLSCGGGTSGPRSPEQAAPGPETSAKTAALETGANALQSKKPVEKISFYLDGFHTAKGDPEMQSEAHHYCNQVTEDLAQCVLFDGNTADARMIGIEYIVSEQVYKSLPSNEKPYWHPHNFEILSGQLRMPGLPEAAEKEALKGKINSYGKTWHTWMSGMYVGRNDRLPMGPAQLQWSFSRDGEAAPGMIAARDQRLHLNTADEERNRRDLVALARPQGGVDAMAGMFPAAKPLMKGIRDTGDRTTKAVPTLGMQGGPPRPTGQ